MHTRNALIVNEILYINMAYNEYKQLNLTQIGTDIRRYWEENETFEKGQRLAEGHPAYVFYDGPPSANGKPGIHHVMARTIKDVFCRYKAQKGYFVDRKAGWDTHGLPVELGVEKNLGITKEDIGTKISVDEYNQACRTEVLKYKDLWDELTLQMGYWVDLKNPYITFDNDYIETLWYLLKKLYDKGLLYKGYTIQPYSPAAGTGLSSHELNMPGCYRDVKDTTCVAMFRITSDVSDWSDKSPLPVYALAWTTTPWTLPSNTALCVGPNIDYVLLETTHPIKETPCRIIMAKALVGSMFPEGKSPEYRIVAECKGTVLEGLRYEQLIPWVKPTGDDAFRIILGDYVTTEDGTGIVHIAPTFGADDARVAKKAGIGELLLFDRDGKRMPMVDKQGRFAPIDDLDPEWVKANVNTDLYGQYAGKFVKNAYDPTKTEKDMSLDVELVIMLKGEGKLLKSEKHTHSYPHCWRTDKPILYYPLDSWFIRDTAKKQRMVELNKTIHWNPESTGTGRFGNWLENLNDWNLSRSRFWGTPLPIWRDENRGEKCIGSVEELYNEIEKSVAAGVMKSNPLKDKGFVVGDYSEENYNKIDLHRPYIDYIVLVNDEGKPMYRESDLIDVWFDSGSMPYAQQHYPFEGEINAEGLKKTGKSESEYRNELIHSTYTGTPVPPAFFPADFINEGVDQTRGWFFTLHAIATMVFDSVAFKNVISSGLVLDAKGNKMSKHVGNVTDPFEMINKYGADPVRFYMMTNSEPWDNLKFDPNGVDEVRRKFFGTLYNTYSFFALYANVDGYNPETTSLEASKEHLVEIDRWILSSLNTLVKGVRRELDGYDPTRAGRLIDAFVNDNLSNWYVRLNRKRFWGKEMSDDKLAAYNTLYTCLMTVAKVLAPFAPFSADQLYHDLGGKMESVHLESFPVVDGSLIDTDLEQRMDMAQKITSMVLALRRKVNIKVRQPLQQILIPAVDDNQRKHIEAVKDLIMNEVNVKELNFAEGQSILVKKVKCNFRVMGKKFGKLMKGVAAKMNGLSQDDIAALEREGSLCFDVDGHNVTVEAADVEIISEDIPGWLVSNEGNLTVALEVELTPELRNEGMARELVNRIQNLRKETGLQITDRINVTVAPNAEVEAAVKSFAEYIKGQVLANSITVADNDGVETDFDSFKLNIKVEKANV